MVKYQVFRKLALPFCGSLQPISTIERPILLSKGVAVNVERLSSQAIIGKCVFAITESDLLFYTFELFSQITNNITFWQPLLSFVIFVIVTQKVVDLLINYFVLKKLV